MHAHAHTNRTVPTVSRGRRLWPMAVIASGALLVAACTEAATDAGVEDVTTVDVDVASSTTTTSQATTSMSDAPDDPVAPASPAVAEAPALAVSLDDFLERWNARNRLLAAQEGGGWELIEIDPDSITVAEPLGDTRPFGAVAADGRLIFGGGLDAETGEVTSILMAYRPDGTSFGATAGFTTIGATADTEDPSFNEAVATFQGVATDADLDRAFATAAGRGYVTESFDADGGTIVQLSVVPTDDVDAAFAAASDLQIAVGDIISGA